MCSALWAAGRSGALSTNHRFPSSSSSSTFIFHHGSFFFQGIFYHRSVPHQLQKPFWLLELLVWLSLDAHKLLVWFLLDVLELQMIYEPSLYLLCIYRTKNKTVLDRELSLHRPAPAPRTTSRTAVLWRLPACGCTIVLSRGRTRSQTKTHAPARRARRTARLRRCSNRWSAPSRATPHTPGRAQASPLSPSCSRNDGHGRRHPRFPEL